MFLNLIHSSSDKLTSCAIFFIHYELEILLEARIPLLEVMKISTSSGAQLVHEDSALEQSLTLRYTSIKKIIRSNLACSIVFADTLVDSNSFALSFRFIGIYSGRFVSLVL